MSDETPRPPAWTETHRAAAELLVRDCRELKLKVTRMPQWATVAARLSDVDILVPAALAEIARLTAERDRLDGLLRQFSGEAHSLFVRITNSRVTPEQLKEMLAPLSREAP